MRVLAVCVLFLIIFSEGSMAEASHKRIFGYVERVVLVQKNLSLSAKLDTGAKSASLNARHVREIEQDGKPYLQFTVPTPAGERLFVCEYLGNVDIKVRAGESRVVPVSKTAIRRPVVRMNIRLGDQVKAIRVNLTNRKRFLYPLLLGREAIIAFDGMIDPAVAFTIKSSVKGSHENQ